MSFFIRKAIRGFAGPHSLVRMSQGEWTGLIAELGRRAGGVRESGAFLLQRVSGPPGRVDRVLYFDDLDPRSLNGGVSLDAAAFGRLWGLCKSEGVQVIADLHTHPGDFVQQSSIDRANPLVSLAGHVAVVVPHLASEAVEPNDCGVHLYLGAHQWRSRYGRDAARAVYVGRWA